MLQKSMSGCLESGVFCGDLEHFFVHGKWELLYNKRGMWKVVGSSQNWPLWFGWNQKALLYLTAKWSRRLQRRWCSSQQVFSFQGSIIPQQFRSKHVAIYFSGAIAQPIWQVVLWARKRSYCHVYIYIYNIAFSNISIFVCKKSICLVLCLFNGHVYVYLFYFRFQHLVCNGHMPLPSPRSSMRFWARTVAAGACSNGRPGAGGAITRWIFVGRNWDQPQVYRQLSRRMFFATLKKIMSKINPLVNWVSLGIISCWLYIN